MPIPQKSQAQRRKAECAAHRVGRASFAFFKSLALTRALSRCARPPKAAAEQPRHEVRVSTWLGETNRNHQMNCIKRRFAVFSFLLIPLRALSFYIGLYLDRIIKLDI
jgi:hypothetical protein